MIHTDPNTQMISEIGGDIAPVTTPTQVGFASRLVTSTASVVAAVILVEAGKAAFNWAHDAWYAEELEAKRLAALDAREMVEIAVEERDAERNRQLVFAIRDAMTDAGRETARAVSNSHAAQAAETNLLLSKIAEGLAANMAAQAAQAELALAASKSEKSAKGK
jgi:hypothetical protein